ncbi:MAG: helix-turn-helix domain-containing protein [Ruminococcaceae bacterium]|nr:helix-turn-helix domain-containing protein [Oscillospiraceae bacterium]
MGARLTDLQKKEIIADYLELGSYNAVAKKHGISDKTVKAAVMSDPDFAKKAEEKKGENAADILSYMETKKNTVCKIIDAYLEALLDPDKIKNATPNQLTTALGTVIDKFTAMKGAADKNSTAETMLSLAELLRNPLPDRNIADYEGDRDE